MREFSKLSKATKILIAIIAVIDAILVVLIIYSTFKYLSCKDNTAKETTEFETEIQVVPSEFLASTQIEGFENFHVIATIAPTPKTTAKPEPEITVKPTLEPTPEITLEATLEAHEEIQEEIFPGAEYKSLGTFKITEYCTCVKCCGRWSKEHPSRINTDYVQMTASGTIPTPGRSIATDISVIPFGTVVLINGHEYIAEDQGSAIVGKRIDICAATHEEAAAFGCQEAEVFIKIIKED